MSSTGEQQPAGGIGRKAVFTAYAYNATMIAEAARLYIPDGARVADVTYGLGAFWRKTDTTRFELLPSDLRTCEQRYDFRALPYADASIDIVVFDPPYICKAGTHRTERWYNHGTTNGLTHAGIMDLYKQGMCEAVRVLKPHGQLWVKCKDELEGRHQRRTTLEVYEIARALGLFDRDLFHVVHAVMMSTKRWPTQRHARKNISSMWIFERLPVTVSATYCDNKLTFCAVCKRPIWAQRSTKKTCSDRCRKRQSRHARATKPSSADRPAKKIFNARFVNREYTCCRR